MPFVKAARIIEPDKPLELNQVEISEPSGTQVLIKVLSTGVCHSDLHLWEGGYDTCLLYTSPSPRD